MSAGAPARGARTDQRFADLSPKPPREGDDGVEGDVAREPVERAAERHQRARVVRDVRVLGVVDDRPRMGQLAPDFQERRELDRRGLADGAPEQGALGRRDRGRCGA